MPQQFLHHLELRTHASQQNRVAVPKTDAIRIASGFQLVALQDREAERKPEVVKEVGI